MLHQDTWAAASARNVAIQRALLEDVAATVQRPEALDGRCALAWWIGLDLDGGRRKSSILTAFATLGKDCFHVLERFVFATWRFLDIFARLPE